MTDPTTAAASRVRRWPCLVSLITGVLLALLAASSSARLPSTAPDWLDPFHATGLHALLSPALDLAVPKPSVPLALDEFSLDALSLPSGGTAKLDVVPSEPDPGARALIAEQLNTGAIHFEPNQGQSAEEVRFLARGPGYQLFLTETEAVMVLRKRARADAQAQPEPSSTAAGGVEPAQNAPRRDRLQRPGMPGSRERTPPEAAVVRMRLEGATRRASPEIQGRERQRGISNYYLGNDPSQWQSGVPHYARVQYDEVYPGIDLVFYGNPRQLEYDFIVAPGADPNQIQLSFEGVDDLRIDEAGNLVLSVEGEELIQQAPRIVQRIDGEERPVAGGYRLLPVAAESGASVLARTEPEPQEHEAETLPSTPRVAFALAEYDRSRPLVIDPVVVYSTYLGGSGWDMATDIAVDSAGNAYVTGTTESSDFPAVDAPFTELLGGSDAFVTKLNPNGQGLIYSTYLGGSSSGDYAHGIAVDSAGNVYVTGKTGSQDFPTVNAVYADPGYRAQYDAFVSKFDKDGQGPLYSTYLAGRGSDIGRGIAVDTAGNAYVVGETNSDDFPTVNALYPELWVNQIKYDAFVTKLNANGQGPLYSTYLGGINGEHVQGVAVDGAGSAYVLGYTDSSNFPIIDAPYPNHNGGLSDYDAFVTKLGPNGQGLIYSTYLGGSRDEVGGGIAVDNAGNAYVIGHTMSGDFPTSGGQYPELWGAVDAFVTKIAPQNAEGEYALTVSRFEDTGVGTVRSEGTGIDCGDDCFESLAAGTPITLIAEPDASSVFKGWSGACSGTGDCQLTMSQNLDVAATFETATPWQNQQPRVEGGITFPAGDPPAHALLITHGWRDNAATWVLDMARAICLQGTNCTLLATEETSCSASVTVQADHLTPICRTTLDGTGWDVWIKDWRTQACPDGKCNPILNPFSAGKAQKNAGPEGELAASLISAFINQSPDSSSTYTDWHLIAHSAGSNLIDTLSRELDHADFHLTFLDGYDPKGEKSRYGEEARWADNYVDTRDVIPAGIKDTTDTFYDFAHSIDVTPDADGCSELDDGIGSCRHDRPVRYYGQSIVFVDNPNDSAFIGNAWHENADPIPESSLNGLGWTLSVEQGQTLSALRSSHPIGRDSTPVIQKKSVDAVLDEYYGDAECETWGCTTATLGRLLNEPAAPSRILGDATEAETTFEPAWLVIEITTTEPTNTLTFNAEFTAGSDGLVSVFLNDEFVGSVDQRFAPADAPEDQEFYLGDLPAGTYKLAFRLDQYGIEESGVRLTEIELGWMELVAGPMLTLTKIGSGSGAVTSDPLGINCGVDCLQGFALGESITLTAQPEEDSRFVGWGGACSGTAQTCQLTITTEVQVNAEFDTEASDADGDEIPDGEDNCPADPNPDQADLDGDQQGDVCDADDDGDGVDDDQDAFPRDPGERADTDGDGIGDNGDNCPSLANPDQADSNSDGIGDACDDLGECAPEALHVQDRIFSRARLHLRSAQSITTSGDVVIPLGAEVIFEAPRHTLGPGFRVAVGARLTVSARAVQCAAASAGDAD